MAQAGTELRLVAVDRVSTVLQKVGRGLNRLNNNLKQSERSWKAYSKRIDKTIGHLTRFAKKARAVGRRMTTYITAPIAGLIAASINEFRKYDKGLVGISKTTNITGDALNNIGEKFAGMSKVIPISTEDLLAYGQVYGQMGGTVGKSMEEATRDIVGFGEIMGKIQTATDIKGEQGAMGIARILNLTNELAVDGDKNLRKFADSLVFLGNTNAALESEILAVATRVAGNIAQFTGGSQEILAYSASLKGLGKEAELAGSVTGKMFQSIQQALLKGGPALEILSSLTGGLNKQEIGAKFKAKPFELLRDVLKGLQTVNNSKGGNVTETLKHLNLEGVRVLDIMGTLIGRLGEYEKNLDAIKNGKQIGSLEQEFRLFSQSLDSDLTMTLNNIKDLGRKIGQYLEPAVRWVLKHVRNIAKIFNDHPGFAKFVGVLAAIVAIAGPVIFFFGALGFLLSGLSTAIGLLGLGAVVAEFGLITTLWGGAVIAAPIMLFFAALGLAIYQCALHLDTLLQLVDDLANKPMDGINDILYAALGSERGQDAMLKRRYDALKPQNVLDAEKKVALHKSKQSLGGAIEAPSFSKFTPGAQSLQEQQKLNLDIQLNAPAGVGVVVKDSKNIDKIGIARGMGGRW